MRRELGAWKWEREIAKFNHLLSRAESVSAQPIIKEERIATLDEFVVRLAYAAE